MSVSHHFNKLLKRVVNIPVDYREAVIKRQMFICCCRMQRKGSICLFCQTDSQRTLFCVDATRSKQRQTFSCYLSRWPLEGITYRDDPEKGSLIEMTLRRDHLSRWPWEGITYGNDPEKESLIEMTLRRDHLSRWPWEGIICRDYPEKGSLIEMTLRRYHLSRTPWDGITYRNDPEEESSRWPW
jgi:hypothetical protein